MNPSLNTNYSLITSFVAGALFSCAQAADLTGPITDGFVDDEIFIDSYTNGIELFVNPGKNVTRDYTAAKQDIVITIRNDDGYGIVAQASGIAPNHGTGVVNLNAYQGDIYITGGKIGVHADGHNGSYGQYGSSSTVNLNATTYIEMSEQTGVGLSTSDGGYINALHGGAITAQTAIYSFHHCRSVEQGVDRAPSQIRLDGEWRITGDIYTKTGEIEGAVAIVDVTLRGNSVFNGKVVSEVYMNSLTAGTELHIGDNSAWHMTGSSTLLALTMDEDGTGAIYFGSGDTIHVSQKAILGQGSLFIADELDLGDSITLFTGATIDNTGALLKSADGKWLYDYDMALASTGVFHITGKSQIAFIPEPATASLGMAGLLLLSLRRKRA